MSFMILEQLAAVFGSRILDYTLALCRGHVDYLERLPDTLLLKILSYISLQDIGHLSQISSRFRKVRPIPRPFLLCFLSQINIKPIYVTDVLRTLQECSDLLVVVTTKECITTDHKLTYVMRCLCYINDRV